MPRKIVPAFKETGSRATAAMKAALAAGLFDVKDEVEYGAR